MSKKPIRIATLCLLAVMLMATIAEAAPMTTNPMTMPKADSTGAYAANVVAEGKSPITGLNWQGDYRPVVVQISNSAEARPHINFAEADVIYESIYWGPAHTRYTAVYNDNHPTVVASVRSARMYHIDIRQEWDAPFVFWGGQEASGTNIFDYFKILGIDAGFLFDGTGHKGTSGAKGMFRVEGRVSPHNGGVNLEEIVSNYWPKDESGAPYEPRMHAYKFSDTPMSGVDSAVEIHIPYDEKEYYPSYTYDATNRVYQRWYNGEEQYDGQSNKRIEASNVIVQFAELTFFANTASRPQLVLTGSGVMDAFIGGRHVRGKWERQTVNDRTVFVDMNGNEITMLPGKTFIQIVPTYWTFTYFRDDGTEMSMDMGTEVQQPMFELEGGEEGMENELPTGG